MNRFRPGRFVGVTAGALVILGLGVYGPATLLGPLPAVRATVLTPANPPGNPSPPALPAQGAGALVVVDASAAGTSSPPLAVAGSAKPLPMASAAKLVTALVVLDAKPLDVGRTGPGVAVTTEDYQGYLEYAADGARAVAVFPGETWTERDLLQALILGSSNNHADMIARWAFGSVDAYLAAANAWLAANGLTATTVADTNGLHNASTGTAADLARLASLAAADPVIAELLANPASALVDLRGVDNTTAYLPELGITGISRSYTETAGVCFLFTAQVDADETAYTFSGALLGEPDYDTLGADLTALMASARAGVGELPVLTKGDAYARFESAWGDTATGVIGVSKARFGWQALASADADVAVDAFTTGPAGKWIGRVTVQTSGDRVSAPLVLEGAIDDPGPGWRLLHPIPVIAALLESR